MTRRLMIEIDPDACVGSGMCVAIASGTFALGQDGQSRVTDPAGSSPAEILEAAEGCPTMAIRVRDAETGEVLFPSPAS